MGWPWWRSIYETEAKTISEDYPLPVQIITIPSPTPDPNTRTNANVSASTTDQVLVAAQQNEKVRVVQLVMLAGATATNVTFNSKPAGSGTALSAQWQLAANGGMVLPYNANGWFGDTNLGEGLSVTTGAGSTVGIQIVTQQVRN